MYVRAQTAAEMMSARPSTLRKLISLCLGDGGRSDVLRWVTHSRPKSATIEVVLQGPDSKKILRYLRNDAPIDERKGRPS